MLELQTLDAGASTKPMPEVPILIFHHKSQWENPQDKTPIGICILAT